MERIELIRFQTQDWYNDPSIEMVIVENPDAMPVLEASALESVIEELGFVRGFTASETSEAYHQVLVGVEGWLVNLNAGEYTRIDRYEINWLSKERGYNRIDIGEFAGWVNRRPGQAAGKKFGI